jgi:hypothetical protein
MDSTNEGREEGPLAKYIDPPIPANPRPGVREIVATTAEYGRWKLARVGLDLDDAIEEEAEDYRQGLKGSIERGYATDADDYAGREPDIALWEGERCLALIRPRPGGDPEITRFDGQGDARPLPEPSTDLERLVWGLVKEHGAETCHKAICEKVYPNLGPGRPCPVVLTDAEDMVLHFVRNLGEKEALERLHLAGAYGVIAQAIGRLGWDAVHELRRLIAVGQLPADVQAATVIGPESPAEVVEESRS